MYIAPISTFTWIVLIAMCIRSFFEQRWGSFSFAFFIAIIMLFIFAL